VILMSKYLRCESNEWELIFLIEVRGNRVNGILRYFLLGEWSEVEVSKYMY